MGGENLDYLKAGATDPATVLAFLGAVAPGYRRYDAWGRPIDYRPGPALQAVGQLFASARQNYLQNQMIGDISNSMAVPHTQPADITASVVPNGEQPNEYTGEGWKQYAEGLGRPDLAPKAIPGKAFTAESFGAPVTPEEREKAGAMPTLPKPTFGQRIKDVEQFRPPSMASYIRTLTPQQRQAFLSGGSTSPLAALFGQGNPPMVQMYNMLHTQGDAEIKYQKQQLFSQAAQALQQDPSNDDAAKAVFSLATDLGQDPMAWQKNLRQRASAIQYLVSSVGDFTAPDGTVVKGYRNDPKGAALALDADPNLVARMMEYQLARNERIKSSTAQYQALLKMNPSQHTLDAAQKLAAAGLPLDTLLQGGLGAQQTAEVWSKYGSLLSGLVSGKPMAGVGLDGKALPWSQEGQAAMQDIMTNYPLAAPKIIELQNAAQQHLIQQQNLAMQREDYQKRSKMLDENNDWNRVIRYESVVKNLQAERDRLPLRPDLAGDQNKLKAALNEADQRITAAQIQIESMRNRWFLKWGNPQDVVTQDQLQFAGKMARIQTMTDPGERIRQGTRLLQELEMSRQAYGGGNPAWREFYDKARQEVPTLWQNGSEEATPQGGTSTWGILGPGTAGMAGKGARAAGRAVAPFVGIEPEAIDKFQMPTMGDVGSTLAPFVGIDDPAAAATAVRDYLGLTPPPVAAPAGGSAQLAPPVTPPSMRPAPEMEPDAFTAGRGAQFDFPKGTKERQYLDSMSPGGDFDALPQAEKIRVFQQVFAGQRIRNVP